MSQIDATDRSGGLYDFVESSRQNFREVRLALEKRHQSKANARLKANNKIIRELAGTVAQTRDLVFVKKSSSVVNLNINEGQVTEIAKVLNAGLIIEVVMEGRGTRTRQVSPKGIKPFHARPPDLRHPLPTSSPKFA